MDVEQNEELQLHGGKFYTDSAEYWKKIPPTINGMLGGFGFITKTDIEGSALFLNSLLELPNPPARKYALDCGAGIGRISKSLLTKYFTNVDLVEQNPRFLQEARVLMQICSSRLGILYPLGLQDFTPDVAKYDVIWCQWVLGYLQNDDLVNFFKRCLAGLKPNGLLVIKENVTTSSNIEVDTKDSSITRPLDNYRHIFEKAGFTCIKEQQQTRLPRGLYPVYMFALRPVRPVQSSRISEIDTSKTSNNELDFTF
ncbi:N-terminal Xaa-Pro-Lys N-methyltransferase 1-A [Orussus abietinus]|uniref:N-terminal Xaa-Pro-Lys N-methyltransferase 1-A n=1 Tax=Orussus abietinus TaxID=222816 RepID=UPI00062523A8|nr:N-terminal Xaa-Pro-Lys N-methyltransferase 1-A [Orussus abietinus]XP_012279671.1 N-terminal Xaa-Pro-Lys N-methyltransferase 1-A [Orussus abietinus]XP_012279679.1 N-terminal Xaa-Pro-Lys N-methyltransferase 1-A [Orussus abietinus]XP_023287793.1 N-terminal Xaa-Pro-Lys N-methyltransferase 1-A [Orussus abietinus]